MTYSDYLLSVGKILHLPDSPSPVNHSMVKPCGFSKSVFVMMERPLSPIPLLTESRITRRNIKVAAGIS